MNVLQEVRRSPVEVWGELIAAQQGCDLLGAALRHELERDGAMSGADVDRVVRFRGRVNELVSELAAAGLLEELADYLAVTYGGRP